MQPERLNEEGPRKRSCDSLNCMATYRGRVERIQTFKEAPSPPVLTGHQSNRMAENLGVKNAAWDKKDGYFVPRDCYNSYFYIVEDETSNLLDKFILHGDRMTRYLDGGSALHANLDEHLSKAQYRHLMDIAIKTKCPYFTYNIPNTVCNDCGFISKHRLTECPKCHSHNLDYLTRVIGYLKRVSAFSQARQEEEKRRHYEKV